MEITQPERTVSGDCENIYDELKNHWGRCDFTVRNLTASAIMAALVATAANWWNAFARLDEKGAHRETTTSRPLLQQTVARGQLLFRVEPL